MIKKIEHYPELVNPQVRPRYSGIPTFFRLPYTERLNEVDIGIIGVPFDGGVTNRTATWIHHLSTEPPRRLALRGNREVQARAQGAKHEDKRQRHPEAGGRHSLNTQNTSFYRSNL